MQAPERPQTPQNEEMRAREDASVSLVAAVGGTALSTLFAFNTVDLVTQYGWKLEAPAIVASSLFTLGTLALGVHEWVKFHRWRDKELGIE